MLTIWCKAARFDPHRAQVPAWIATSSKNGLSPMGDTINRTPYAEFKPSQGQPIVPNRAAQLAWLSTAQREGVPACQVVSSIVQEQTLHQAAVAGGIDPDTGRLIVGIPENCF